MLPDVLGVAIADPEAPSTTTGTTSGTTGTSSGTLGNVDKSFISIHQMAEVTIAKPSGGSEVLLGFKKQYAPTGISGCAIGYPEYRSLCVTPVGGLAFSLPGWMTFTRHRVFIPAGTTFFSLTGNLPQNVKCAVAIKFGSAPSRTQPLSDAEYETRRSSQNIETAYSKLAAGQELVMVHSYGGNMSLSGNFRIPGDGLSEGKYLYFNVINSTPIYILSGIYEVNKTVYASKFNTLTFDSVGDPT